MSASRLGCLAGLVGLTAALLFATAAWAETNPPTTPGGRNASPPKGVKWIGPDFDAIKADPKGKGTARRRDDAAPGRR